MDGDNTGQNISELHRHTDMAMDVVIIPNTPLLASASLDSKIVLVSLLFPVLFFDLISFSNKSTVGSRNGSTDERIEWTHEGDFLFGVCIFC